MTHRASSPASTRPSMDQDLVRRHAMAHDASHYLLVPEAVATPEGEDAVVALLRQATASGRPLTFRSGGTSLSGQAQTDGVLADVRTAFRTAEVLDEGARVRVGPGVTVRHVNAKLARYGRRLGPDPASEGACTLGGVIANNSSGMAAGTEQNTYRTMESVRAVLPSGIVLDTSQPDADARLRHDAPDLHAGLLRLRDRVRGNNESVRIIRERFAMKNTMGYGVNAFLDFDEPAQILAHLLIGSEGTLGFISEAVFSTVKIEPKVTTGLLTFPTLAAATAALPALVDSGLATVELLDARSLRVAQRLGSVPQEIASVDVDGHAAFLVEQRADTDAELKDKEAAVQRLASGLDLASAFAMTTDPARRAALWSTRKGLYASVAGARPQGSTALLEDVVVPVQNLGETCAGLQELFDRHTYEECVIFGHAKDGNIHFLVNESLTKDSTRLADFTEDMVELVLAQGGNLKAEHGTGRVMAPFVRRQYGDELYEVMWEVKRLVDPAQILNPGVVLTEDPTLHLRDLKPTVPIEVEADRCVECGYCEPVCPSKDLTLTPRQRIVLRRDAARAEQTGDLETAAAIREAYEYQGKHTCAVDGMCLTACPVGINTGDLVRRLRAEDAPAPAEVAWKAAAGHWGAVTRGASAALTVAGAVRKVPVLGGAPRLATHAARAVGNTDLIPEYRPELPNRGGAARRVGAVGAGAGDPELVYMPACVHTMFGPADDDGATSGIGAAAAFERLLERAGVVGVTPESVGDLCCGTPFSSKGMTEAKELMRGRLTASLAAASLREDGTRLPVVVDALSCTEGVLNAVEAAGAAGEGIEVVDALTFTREVLLPRLTLTRPVESVTVHPTCSSQHLGAADDLVEVARACVADPEDVHVPVSWGCCAYAGDRGMLHPELTASATRAEAAEVKERPTQWYVSGNRTCELGMKAATGHEYRHALELLEVATRP
ncbi:FAD-binding and (Fe-S)-binding domain-containing protein [Micrococcus sp.]|uniref:FAD-binding and (Fe-S)-binding domain-containing protein n=1 Tax=Micrococcus sp. TaxID=1271 RepID=UPI002A917E98|nr:FAD-binding and (Fe-S)-binding domain-containing protein [Micrococcus sp.]MDY6055066.1 FAD-binding and (Fe-S)-binding domain-containing protein [Micrococcus sp.]